jgi:hypothetical protein
MAPLRIIAFAEDDSADTRGEKRSRTKRKKKQKEAETPGWEASAGKWRASRKKGKRDLQTLAGWTFAILAVFTASFFLLKSKEAEVTTGTAGEVDDFDELVKVPLLIPDEDLEEPIELPKIMRRSEAEFLSLAQPLAEAFLSATTLEELLPLIRDGERMKPKLIAHHPDGKINAPGLSRFNPSGHVSYKDSFAAVSILTPDFESKQLAFVDGADGLKIDWESWVGWSEMPWQNLSESRPTRPVLIRAMMKSVNYYNFNFADESKWRSYRLVSPDGEHMLYGYAERNSLLDQRLQPREQSTSVAVTVKIRFPDEGDTRNQVMIDDYITDGWIIPDQAK